MSDAPEKRYPHAELVEFAFNLLEAAGMPDLKAVDVADVLLEGDLLGRTTHGLQLLPWYLAAVRDGSMQVEGSHTIVSDESTALVWDGRHLPGPWLVKRAITEAERRLQRYPLVTVVIQRSHHIAALQAYLQPVVEKGLIILLANSDPGNKWVAPHGAVEPIFTPNPIAAGIPTDGDPLLIDISTSTTAMGQCSRAAREGGRLPGAWLVDADGNPSDDPKPVADKAGGAILPLGGLDLGYKGFALALIVEALTAGLAGLGRANPVDGFGGPVFLQLINPSRFGGLEAFRREIGFLANACRRATVPEGAPSVRMPGEHALALRADQLTNGVMLHPSIMPALHERAEELSVKVPESLR